MVRSNSILFTFWTKARLRLHVARSITRCKQKKVSSWHCTLRPPNFNVLIVIINFVLAKNHRENIVQEQYITSSKCATF